MAAFFQDLRITSPAFRQGCPIPVQYTGFGADISPAFQISGLCQEAVSLAVIMDDLDIPLVPAYCHWLIWNIPCTEELPEHIPHGSPVLVRAVQGMAYGQHRYRGPKPPLFVRTPHRYVFRFYALDCFLDLGAQSNRPALVNAMTGHVLQKAVLWARTNADLSHWNI